jgi:hypothetical protein
MLDEFKFITYKARIESLKGAKKPLMDLLKELTELYGQCVYTEDPLQQVSNLYYVLLTCLCKSHSSAKHSTTIEVDRTINNNARYCYAGLNDETIKYADILLSNNTYSWDLKTMQEVIKLNEQLSKIPYNPNISIDLFHVDRIYSLLPMYGEDRRKIIHEYIASKIGADAPILQYYPINAQPYTNDMDPQIYLDLAQIITNLKEPK